MKISVIFTGGTIGSKVQSNEISLGNAPYELMKNAPHDIEFVTDEPYSILSEELKYENLYLLSQCIDKHLDISDGIIVTHGTDTLVYTAAFLSYVFCDLQKPIMIVSSNRPLDDPNANGWENFKAAVSVMRENLSGVYVPWFNNGQTILHNGSRLVRQGHYSDSLNSVPGEHAKKRIFPAAHNLPEQMKGFGSVLYLKCMPCMIYPKLDIGISAVILESYHSGTLCADSRFSDFLNCANALDIPVFVAGTKGSGDTQYSTVNKYKMAGAVPLPPASPDVMYIKLCLAVSISTDTSEIKRIMTNS